MAGRPVWLASVTLRDALGGIRPTPTWLLSDYARAERVLGEVLRGVGDQTREVVFRMNLTLCRHRGLTEEEEAGLPEAFQCFAATDTAGSAVAVLWRHGVSGLAIEPCANPGRAYIEDRQHFWVPVPCGACEPCLAREACAAA